ncbi:hypothetical protein GHI93_00805 [Lactococcus hircilactis]|uniref:Prealbumin-like fold domain-containing protein n=1 Tax=Lactococcus hircilactis TaxID=1494462 RepID=A0A7X1Z8L0_9LACT|nr:SpaA isopeptide-forming pilin-related protein [Lactococcus hircilactis]MQW38490.1 hypothetical protein [Lactococcus hircilactis]
MEKKKEGGEVKEKKKHNKLTLLSLFFVIVALIGLSFFQGKSEADTTNPFQLVALPSDSGSPVTVTNGVLDDGITVDNALNPDGSLKQNGLVGIAPLATPLNPGTANASRITVANLSDVSTWTPSDYTRYIDMSNATQTAFGTDYNGNSGTLTTTGTYGTSLSTGYHFSGFPVRTVAAAGSNVTNYTTDKNGKALNFGLLVTNVNYAGTPIDIKLTVTAVEVGNTATQALANSYNLGADTSFYFAKQNGIWSLKNNPQSIVTQIQYTLAFYYSGTTTPFPIKNSLMYGDQEGLAPSAYNTTTGAWTFPAATAGNIGEGLKLQNGNSDATMFPQYYFWAANGAYYKGTSLQPEDTSIPSGTKVPFVNMIEKFNDSSNANDAQFNKQYGYYNPSTNTIHSNVEEFVPEQAQFSFLYNGASSSSIYQQNSIPASGATVGASSYYWNFLGFATITPSQTPPPVKYVSDSDESMVSSDTLSDIHEHFTYTLDAYFPVQYYSDFNLENWKLTDVIPPGLTVDTANIKAYLSGGSATSFPSGWTADTNVSSDFTPTINNGTLSFTAASSILTNPDTYGKYNTVRFVVPVYVTDSSKVQRDANGKVAITNTTTNSGTYFNGITFSNNSNQVITTVPAVEDHLSISKTVDKTTAEIGTQDPATPTDPNLQPINYTIPFSNTSSVTTMNSVRLLDVLPWDNDGRGTVGVVSGNPPTLSAMTVIDKATGKAATNARIYYTASSGTASATTDPNTLPAESAITANGYSLYTGGSISNTRAILVYVDNLPANDTYTLSFSMSYGAGHDGTVLYNNARVNSVANEAFTSNTVKTTIYGRSLSGFVWYDDDYDGLFDNGESKVANIPVKLYRTSNATTSYQKQLVTSDMLGNKFVDSSGNSLVNTDSNGNYSFNNLPEGTYIVEFQINGKVVQVTKELSQSTASDNINSKVTVGTNRITDTPASGSLWSHTGLPLANLTASNTSSGTYNMYYNNLGLNRTANLEIFKYRTGTLVDSNKNGNYDPNEIAAATPIPGAGFEIYKGNLTSYPADGNKDSAYVTIGTTNSSGKLDVNAGLFGPNQTYTIFEVQAPVGYELAKSPYTFTVTTGNQTINLQIPDSPQTTLPFAGNHNGAPIFAILIAFTSMSGLGLLAFGIDWVRKGRRVQ